MLTASHPFPFQFSYSQTGNWFFKSSFQFSQRKEKGINFHISFFHFASNNYFWVFVFRSVCFNFQVIFVFSFGFSFLNFWIVAELFLVFELLCFKCMYCVSRSENPYGCLFNFLYKLNLRWFINSLYFYPMWNSILSFLYAFIFDFYDTFDKVSS